MSHIFSPCLAHRQCSPDATVQVKPGLREIVENRDRKAGPVGLERGIGEQSVQQIE